MTGTVYLSGEEWLRPALMLLALAAMLVLWAYHRAPAEGRIRGACVGLKILGFLLLLLCLIDPMGTAERAKPGANILALAADNSEGMNLTDAGTDQSRAATLRAALKPGESTWQHQLVNEFEVRRYSFDSRLRTLDSFAALKFDGTASHLGRALRTLARRYRSQPLAGIVVFTDGIATDLDAPPDIAGLPPIYPVILGKQLPKRDVALAQVTVTQTAFEDAPVTVRAQVTCRGCPGETITARLEQLNRSDDPTRFVQDKKLTSPAKDGPLAFRFQIRPTGRNIMFYRLTVAPDGKNAEATRANNTRVVVVDRGGGPHRVLYVSGRANWEFKFLQRALADDRHVDLVGMIRIAKREPKFAFKGRADESSNPLFRGFKNKDQDQESYDKPVLIRLGTRDAEELKTGFPQTPEELYAYHAVIVDDLEAAFFPPSQHTLLQNFVKERGGGFLMLGGQESFRQGKYNRTPIGTMLPVYLDRPADTKALQNLRLTLTRDGWLQPWTRLRDNEHAERERLGGMAKFVSLNRIRQIKPGARVLSTVHVEDNREQHPALVTHAYGHGRVAALLLGDMWRWGLRDTDAREDMDKAWRQMIRWLVANVPDRISLTTRSAPSTGRRLNITLRDPAFQPLENAHVKLTLTRIGATNTSPVTLPAEPDPKVPGLFQAQYLPRDSGGYLAQAETRDADGKLLGRRQAGWATDFAAQEYRTLAPNRALLEAIARKTGGEVLTLDDLDTFASRLPSRRAPVTETHHFPLWHQTYLFLLALGCFVLEWYLRRWKGLP